MNSFSDVNPFFESTLKHTTAFNVSVIPEVGDLSLAFSVSGNLI